MPQNLLILNLACVVVRILLARAGSVPGRAWVGLGSGRVGHGSGWVGRGSFFCSNALIALARSLCKCLLAMLITASEADAVTGFLVRGASQYDTIPRREKKSTATKPTQARNKTTKKQEPTQKSTKTPQETKHHELE